MEAKELRLGNKALRKGILHEHRSFHEISITASDIQACVIDGSHFQPIPLTEEFLSNKTDFTKIGILYEKGEFAIKAWKVGDEIEWIIFWGNQVILKKKNYKVHQLQNLYFALTGEELNLASL